MTEPMKTADEFLNSKTYIQRWDDYIPRSARYITKVMDEYADLKVAAERERILSEVRKYVFWHDKFFNDTIVGQPPSLQPLRDLIKD